MGCLAERRELALAMCLLAVGCGGEAQPLDVHVVFADESTREAAALVEVRIHAGGCGTDEVRYAAEVARDGGGASRPPELAPGSYGFAAIAYGIDCAPVAEGCTERTLPMEGGFVEVSLLPVTGAMRCPADQCANGQCRAAPDGGVDAGMDAEADAAIDATDDAAIDVEGGTDAADGSVDADDAGECERDSDCDDGVYCNGEEKCDGRCVPGAMIACDDHIACTADACDESSERCIAEASASSCASACGATLVYPAGSYGSVLAVGDQQHASAFVCAIRTAGYEVTVVPTMGAFDGTVDLTPFAAVVVFSTVQWSVDMPLDGQTSLLSWVGAGGGLVLTEWSVWSRAQGRFATLAPLFPVTYGGSYLSGQRELTVSALGPLTSGFGDPFLTPTHTFSNADAVEGASVAFVDASGRAAAASRSYGLGRVGWLSFTTNAALMADPNLPRMFVNALDYAARGAVVTHTMDDASCRCAGP